MLLVESHGREACPQRRSQGLIMEFPGGLSVWQLLVTTVPFTNNPSPKEQGPEPGQQVPLQFAPVPGMSVQFDADADGIVRCYGHVGFQMEGPDPLATVMITLGFQLDGSWLESGAKAGENGDPLRALPRGAVLLVCADCAGPPRGTVDV
jgi:hypothetical protein